MPKIDKTDLENISLIKKEFKLKNITTIKIKKGNYEIELSSETKVITKSAINSQNIEEKVEKKTIFHGKKLFSNFRGYR